MQNEDEEKRPSKDAASFFDNEEGEAKSEEPEPNPKMCCSARLFVCMGCFFALFNLASVRVGVSMAFVCMVTPSRRDSTHVEKTVENWSSVTKGYLLSAVFYGFIVGPFLGGYLSFRFSGKVILVTGTIGAGATNFFIPEAIRFSFICFFVIRVVTGVFAGFIIPAFFDIASHWVVTEEAQVLVAVVLLALPLGNILTFPLLSVACVLVGWVWIFYIFAIWMVLLGVVLCFVLGNSPEKCPCISKRELRFLNRRIPICSRSKVPWKRIVTSLPIYAYVIMHFSVNYVFLSMMLSLPLFVNQTLNVTFTMNGFLSAMPFVGTFVMRLLLGFCFEHLRRKLKLSKNTLRKTLLFLGASFVSVFLFTATLLNSSYMYGILFCFLFAMMSLELCMTGGYLLSLLDLCPSYVNIISGMANTIANSAGLIGPVVNGWITPRGTKEEWNAVFYVNISLILLSSAFYLAFGRNHLLSWGVPPQSAPRNSSEGLPIDR